VLGKGAYGVVASAVDNQTGDRVAIKKCFKLFNNLDDAKRVAREVRILSHLNHPHIVNFLYLQPPAQPRFADLYLVSELMDTDMFNALYRRAATVDLNPTRIRSLSYQLLLGLKYLHSMGIIHRYAAEGGISITGDGLSPLLVGYPPRQLLVAAASTPLTRRDQQAACLYTDDTHQEHAWSFHDQSSSSIICGAARAVCAGT
jgi:hypothetical protein